MTSVYWWFLLSWSSCCRNSQKTILYARSDDKLDLTFAEAKAPGWPQTHAFMITLLVGWVTIATGTLHSPWKMPKGEESCQFYCTSWGPSLRHPTKEVVTSIAARTGHKDRICRSTYQNNSKRRQLIKYSQRHKDHAGYEVFHDSTSSWSSHCPL